MFPSETFTFLNDFSFPFKDVLKASATDWDVSNNDNKATMQRSNLNHQQFSFCIIKEYGVTVLN